MLTKLYVKLQALRGDEGATALEYAILVAFVALAVLAGAMALGGSIGGLFNRVATNVNGM